MTRRVHKPAFPLSQYVEFIWHVSGPAMPSSRQRVYPTGAMVLAIHLQNPAMTFFVDNKPQTIRVPLLAGPYSRSFEIDPSRSAPVLGVMFRPGAARLFFPVAAHELHNLDLALHDLHAGEADRLLNDVCAADGEQAQILVVERYLTRKLKKASPVPPAVRYAVEQLSGTGGLQRVEQIRNDTALSHTRLIQLFREHIGLTPKLFCRVRRFHAVLERIEKGMPIKWASLAADCGYFDQAHLIHDFRAFAGITPGEYTQSMPDSLRQLLAAAIAS